MLSALLAKIRSFCELNWASTDKIFSSEKKISPASMPSFIQFWKILALSILFCFCNAVNWCLLVIFKGDNLRPSLTIVLTYFLSIFKSLAIFLGVPPYPFGAPLYLLPNGLNFGWGVSSLQLPTFGTII